MQTNLEFTASVPLLPAEGQLSVPNFEKGRIRKNECLGDLKEFLQQIFALEAYYVPYQKRLCKVRYGFEGLISNVDLSFVKSFKCGN